jgi:KUP system potassium uptake protein
VLLGLGLFGVALVYGDGIITPAISVLSATEGLALATPAFAPSVVPATLVLLILLFSVQKYGSGRVGRVFGPMMLVWFTTIGTLGAAQLVHEPTVLLALNPWYGVRLFGEHGVAAFRVLGGVVLAVAGAEALSADLGHFGRRPIRLAWSVVVFPALLLSYFGQGALVLADREAIASPFYLLVPRPLLVPLVGLATAATIIASQALIAGVFSLSKQSILLRYLPRMSIVHTSREARGQIYLPAVNTALMLGCLLLVAAFRSSSALGSAYGVAVTGTMAITTTVFYAIVRHRWRWPGWQAGAVTGGFLTIELALFAANIVKIESGGWVPLALAGAVLFVMTTWRRGTELVRQRLAELSIPLPRFLEYVELARPPRVHGTAVFLTPNLDGTPVSLLLHFRHNHVLHEEVILLTIVTEEVPEVAEEKRVTSQRLPARFWRVQASYGCMQHPDVPRVVAICCEHGMRAEPGETSYVLGASAPAPDRARADGALAQACLRVHGVERELRHRFLPPSGRSRHRARRSPGALRRAPSPRTPRHPFRTIGHAAGPMLRV